MDYAARADQPSLSSNCAHNECHTFASIVMARDQSIPPLKDDGALMPEKQAHCIDVR